MFESLRVAVVMLGYDVVIEEYGRQVRLTVKKDRLDKVSIAYKKDNGWYNVRDYSRGYLHSLVFKSKDLEKAEKYLIDLL